MIPVTRVGLNSALAGRLNRKTQALKDKGADVEAARKAWIYARPTRRDLRAVLAKMAPGISRCMYCNDGPGTDIDHFKPIALDPYFTFVWDNHLLSCSYCNSSAKVDKYPYDADGDALLIDPTLEDPYDHIELIFSTGDYEARTQKGAETIRVLDLQRSGLVYGRKEAYVRCRSMLRDWRNCSLSGKPEEAKEVLQSLTEHPFANVLYAMIRLCNDSSSTAVFGGDVISALRDLPAWP